MSFMFKSLGIFASLAALGVFAAGVVRADDQQNDDKAVTNLLKQAFQAARWERGPTRPTSKPVEAAYPGSRFYYVFSPQYPVARVGTVSAVVQIDPRGKLHLIKQAADYNEGLTAVHTAAEATTAAAAIMSLMLGPLGPTDVTPQRVQVAGKLPGWTAQSNAAQGHWQVEFNAHGRCTAADYKHTGPLPICVGGLFRLQPAPPGLRVGNQPVAVALWVDSVETRSIAERAGLRHGDLWVGFAGRPLPSQDTIQQLRQVVYPLKQTGGASRSVTLLRNGQIINATLNW